MDDWNDLWDEDPPPAGLTDATAVVEVDETLGSATEDVAEPVAGQESLFGTDRDFHAAWTHWKGMPEFIQEDLEPAATVTVKFQTEADRDAFAELIEQPVRGWRAGAGIWYPPIAIGHYYDKRYRDASEGETR